MDDHWQLVENLGVKHRAKDALHSLMEAGPLATPALRRGSRHPDPVSRVGCCIVLDHFLDEEAVPELIENLSHENDEVRAWALHALACDKCKEGECRPGEDESVPLALRMLAEDESVRVRVEAIQLVFPAVHSRDDVRVALEQARDFDQSPKVRKAAGLRAPGGIMYLRSSPERPGCLKSNARGRLTA